MSNALTTTSQPIAALVPERFANPLRQIQGALAQPAVRRAGPMALLVGLVGAAALAWATLSTPTQKTLFTGLADSDKASVTSALEAANIDSHIDEGTNAVTVGEDDYSRARMLLASQGLPKAAPGGYAILDQLPMGVSRAVEGERLRQARETELARSIEEIDSVAEARVHLAMPESTVFVRDNASPSASVVLKLSAGRSLGDAQVSSIINLVASSVPGMKPDAVTLVDQMGGLLSKSAQDSNDASDARLRVQRQVEDKVQQQLSQLLTPLVGAGNFTAEVQADVNMDETSATRESFDKQGTLRTETGNWTGKDGNAAPGGIPGALSNTPPPASELTTPKPATGVGANGGPATAEGGKASDSFERAYDLGKEVSVTHAAAGGVKRLSVAVLLRDPDKGRRTAMEINQITTLVRSAVGFDQGRNDQVTVISRKFAGGGGVAADAPKWYDNAWLPVLARNATALVIALMVLLIGVKPLVSGLLKRREDGAGSASQPGLPMSRPAFAAPGEDGAAVQAPVGLDQIANSRSYDDKIGAVRGFTRDNPARAALAVRDMISADGKS